MNKTLPQGWRRVRLGEVLEQVNRVEKVKPDQEYRLLGVRWYAQGVFERERKLGKLIAAKQLNRVEEGDFLYNRLFAWKGSFAVVGNGHAGGYVSGEFPIFQAKPSAILAEFLFRYFSRPYVWKLIEHYSTGTTNVSRNRWREEQLLSWHISLPPLVQQHRIVSVLQAVDAMVEANEALISCTRQINNSLARQLLSAGLPGHHRRFKDSPAGIIPACWEVKPLGALVREQIRNGFSANAVEQPTGRWILSLSAVSERGFNPNGVKPLALEKNAADAFTLEPGDLLVSRSNTKDKVGLSGIYEGNPVNCAYPDLLMRVRVRKEEIDNKFLEYWLLSPVARRYFSRHARGTSGSMVKINRAILEQFPVPVPSAEEQKVITTVIGNTGRAEESARSFVGRLQTTRSLLTQLLVTGGHTINP